MVDANFALNHRVECLQIRILLGQVAEGAIHLETDLQVSLGIVDVAKQRFVAPHVVVIDWLFQEGDRAGDEEILGFSGFAKLMEAKAGMKKTGAGIGSDAAKLLADAQGE